MDSVAKPSLASQINALVDTAAAVPPAPEEAQRVLAELRQQHPELPKFLEQRFTRLPPTHQDFLITLLEAARAQDFVAALQRWSRQADLPLHTRYRAYQAQAQVTDSADVAYGEALAQAESLYQELSAAEATACTDSGELTPEWREAVAALDFPLALAVAHALTTDHPDTALAIVRARQGATRPQETLELVECMATIPLERSATLLHDVLANTTDKGLQKAVKKSLHRLKAQGVAVGEVQTRSQTLLGNITYRLERCLASFIDGAGDRMLLMIRTKPFGGYNIAYLVINYGTGIQRAIGLQANKRELPEILQKAQMHAPLIELEANYCQYQVALAQQMNLETNTPVPEEFFLLRDIIGETHVTFDQAIIYSVLSEADLQAIPAQTAAIKELLNLPEFAGWTLPVHILQKYADALQDIESSQIVVSQTMRQERINEVHAQAIEEALGEQSRRLMRLRLEEMAYYLWQTQRQREALWAVAAAQSLLDDHPHRLRHNPFAGALFDRSLALAKDRPSNRIILPSSRLPSRPSQSLIV